MTEWLLPLACLVLLIFILTWRKPAGQVPRNSLTKVALLYGIRPLWGETDASLRQRAVAASRNSSAKGEPRFVWWARIARRIGARIAHGLR
jgi:hypothetical protein